MVVRKGKKGRVVVQITTPHDEPFKISFSLEDADVRWLLSGLMARLKDEPENETENKTA